MSTESIAKIVHRLREFIAERDWDQFHSPKNLSIALSVEVSEILEIFQWMSDEESGQLSSLKLNTVKEEIGDITIYLLLLADKLGINILQAASDKIKINESKYPADKSRGTSKKYNEL
jgi:dCTP diphosphatase